MARNQGTARHAIDKLMGDMASEGGGKPSVANRNRLLEIEAKVRKWWEDGDVFRADCDRGREKFFGNFPFPYMNGYLHLGHAFSASKLEFAAAYHRLRGANVLFPFAFHCTGMPIKASADKLAREIQKFGNPPVFPRKGEGEDEEEVKEGAENGAAPPEKFKGKKSKAVSKSGGQARQWEIMRSFGLSDSEIAEFQDPYKWLVFFPPLAVEDLKAFGVGVDWRRSFVTTEKNPFFDALVKWQMRKLKAMGKIVKDVRYAIYSPLDGQPCADHDRATGEGLQPQEYTIIKMELLQPFPPKLAVVLEGRRVFLAAATLRPETMYGQTNAWVFPDGKYGAFEINETDIFIITERAALNLAYQKYSRIPERPTCLVKLTGHDLVGLKLQSPLAFNHVIYALPMLSILMDKGTGIVTSVPSDSPDDYMALHDLKSKPAFRAKFGVKDEWILPFDIVPIINIPEFGDRAAEKVCSNLMIKSQNEKEKLAEAKRLTYLRGFTEGTMVVGEFAGRKVQEARPLIRSNLLETGEAIAYSEPEKRVISRSGDECVVALTDQWYITYGEAEWKALAEECLANMNLYADETRRGFEHTLGWLNQWACSRSFGLGTRIPWDDQFLVDSLSDSTIYMAYYTVAHLLHENDMYGARRCTVKPDQLTDEVWDFVFCGGPYPKVSGISPEILNKMKQEFEYWYPSDIRVSGKDLIQNHLTFCIYNHTAIMGKHHWPRGFRVNGHLMLDSKKMSKSTGNFRTIRQEIEEQSASATRFALADAGDGLDDANYVSSTANSAIQRLTREITWMEQVLNSSSSSLRSGPPSSFADRVFSNAINIAVSKTEHNYQGFMFRDALKTGFYDLQAARDEYRVSCEGRGMHPALLKRFMDVQTRLVAPICPHYAEYVWREVLKQKGFVIRSGWPEAGAPDLALMKANKYLQDSIVAMRSKKPVQKRGAAIGPPNMVCLIYVKEQYDGWQAECLGMLRSRFKNGSCSLTLNDDRLVLEAIQDNSIVCPGDNFRMTQKLCMPFLRFKKKEAAELGIEALDLRLPFREMEVLEENLDLIKKQIKVNEAQVLSITHPDACAKAGPLVGLLQENPPFPGSPTPIFLPCHSD